MTGLKVGVVLFPHHPDSALAPESKVLNVVAEQLANGLCNAGELLRAVVVAAHHATLSQVLPPGEDVRLDRFVGVLGVDKDDVEWRPVHCRGIERRMAKREDGVVQSVADVLAELLV